VEKSLGVVSMACDKVGVSRTTFYDYKAKDPEFREAVESVKEIAVDFVESQLFKQIKEGSTAATIFYLKCQGKKRGYIEKQEIEHSGKVDNGGVNINVMKDGDVKEVQKLINGN
jgi:hypothetical protein